MRPSHFRNMRKIIKYNFGEENILYVSGLANWHITFIYFIECYEVCEWMQGWILRKKTAYNAVTLPKQKILTLGFTSII